MAAEDISRSAFYPSKRYRGVRMQQGRVLTDDDWNSQDDIAADDLRQTRLHVIGAAGTPDDGFKMVPVAPASGEIDFELLAGTYYVSGHRVTLPESIRYAAQPDWLDQPAALRTRPSEPRTDFAYLEVWEQPVTAVEDDELHEKALGGPDTTTRRRLMARVRLLADIEAADCDDAWDLLAAELAGSGTLDDSGALIPDLELQVAYAEDGVPADLCTPSVTAGYLGAENQAIRVQLVDGELVWGLDDAAPPYRATLDAAGGVLTFLGQPRDAAHWPLAGQTIEILRPAATLDNGEVLAAVKGHLTTLSSSYDPSTTQVTLTDAHPDAAELAALDHVYVRMWRRGSDLSSPATTPVAVGTPVALGNLGVTVTVTGDDVLADAFWVIAVRPETPDVVVPWQLEDGRAPEGIRRFFAPIGMLQWSPGAGDELEVELEDCRPSFAPLTAQRGCCRYTVGDGATSRGQFSKIQDAINALPADGGVICLLPGTWEENVVIADRRDITIHGCHQRSLVAPLDPELATFSIRGGENIRIEELAIENPVGIAVEILPGGRNTGLSDRITLHDLDVAARDRAAVVAIAVTRLTMTGCRIAIDALESDIGEDDVGAWPAAYLQVRDARIEGNRIEAEIGERPLSSAAPGSSAAVPARTALGGIQIAGQSQRVDLLGNRISGGLGHGITLGSVIWSPAEAEPSLNPFGWLTSLVFLPPYVVTDCCPEITPNPPGPVDEDGDTLVPSSEGDLADVRIVDNHIDRMGACGIGVARFFGPGDDLIHVERLTVRDNRIRDCLWLEISVQDPAAAAVAGWGGVALASVAGLELCGNHIEANGATTADPSCGVFALLVEGLGLERNRIVDNGRPLVSGDAITPGHRGGVVVLMAMSDHDVDLADDIARDQGGPAARVVDNVVASPDGPALDLSALGDVTVHGNHLSAVGWDLATSQALARVNGDGSADPRYFTGVTVRLVNLGRAHDLVGANSQNRALQGSNARLLGGRILFDHNQVDLDLRGVERSLVLASVYANTRDDLGVTDNQMSIESASGDSPDLVFFNLAVLGATVRVSDNRCQEGLGRALASALSFGWLNSTTDNQGTHCFLALGLSAGLVAGPNRSVMDLVSESYCENVTKLAGSWNPNVKLADHAAGSGYFGSAVGGQEVPPGKRLIEPVEPNPPVYNRVVNF